MGLQPSYNNMVTPYCIKMIGNRFAIHLGLVVSTQVKNISQIGAFPQVGVNIKKIETTT